MKGITTAWLNDFPENKVTAEEKEITESEEVEGGGLIEILNYFIKKITTKEYNFMEYLNTTEYKEGDEKDNFAKTDYCSDIVKYILDDDQNNIIVGIEAEARFIVATAFQYVQKLEFLKNEEKILALLEQGGWTKEEIEQPEKIAENLLLQELKKPKNNADLLKLTADYVESYFKTKSQQIKNVNLKQAESFFKNKELSSKKFKAIARSLGATNSELHQLLKYHKVGNTKELELFLLKSRKASGSTDDVLKKMYQSNKELKSILGSNTQSIKNLVRKSGYANKFVKLFTKKTLENITLVDQILSLKDAYEPEKMMDNMLSAAGSVISASAGFGVSVLLAIGNDHWDRFEEDTFKTIYISCGISWYELCELDRNDNFKIPQYKRLFLQYKKEEHILLSNKKVVPTSIRVLDSKKASEIFGFIPKYVNYFLYNHQNFPDVCCTNYYDVNY